MLIRLYTLTPVDHYIYFNRPVDFNKGTQEGGNQVLITKMDESDTAYGLRSELVAKLSKGGVWKQPSTNILVEVTSIGSRAGVKICKEVCTPAYVKVESETCETNGYNSIYTEAECRRAADEQLNHPSPSFITGGPSNIDGCSFSILSNEHFVTPIGTCDTSTGAICKCTSDLPCLCEATSTPTLSPTRHPTKYPTELPTSSPSKLASNTPSSLPSYVPSELPSILPSHTPSTLPSDFPSTEPSDLPSDFPSIVPSDLPSEFPSIVPSDLPSEFPSIVPSDLPSDFPSVVPSELPSDSPSTLEICSVSDLKNSIINFPLFGFCWRVKLSEGSPLIGNPDYPACLTNDWSQGITFNQVVSFDCWGGKVFFWNPQTLWSGSFKLSKSPQGRTKIEVGRHEYGGANRDFYVNVLVPNCLAPDSCLAEKYLGDEFYVPLFGKCFKIQVFNGGILSMNDTDPDCSKRDPVGQTIVSTFGSVSNRNIYFNDSKRYNRTIRIFKSSDVTFPEIQNAVVNDQLRYFSADLVLPKCKD